MSANVLKLAAAFARAIEAAAWQDARAAAHELIALQPSNPALYYNLGLVLKRLGEYREATTALRHALSLDRSHHNASFELGGALLELGDLEAAAGCFEAYLLSQPHDADARLNAARINLRLGNHDEASCHLGHLPDTGAEVQLVKAELARERAEIDTMWQHLHVAAGLAPSHRPDALKIASQGAAGRLPLDSTKAFASP